MGKDPGTSRAAVTDPQDSERIQQDIERTREELGDTVEALAEKTDVKAQAKKKADATKASLTDKKEQLLGKVSEVSPESATSALGEASRKARDNPLPFAAAGAFAVGFLFGRTRR
jgi:ElaB/YqjD/DUF883 family membrane-anchored ribosome-binding protein